ncbi:MAG TPA: zf-HC2 domain-containing protein [Thermoanaerobaculia bacterium]|jgi:anti-sigma factor RsiW
MSPVCAVARGNFGAYLQDSLSARERRALRDHLAGCSECRGVASAHDSTLLFAGVWREEMPAAETEQILRAVRTGVSLMEAERRTGTPRASILRRSLGAAAAAALAVLTLLEPGGSTRPPGPGIAEAPAARPSGEAKLQPVALPGSEAPRSNATVYDWNPGAGRGEPRVVWIVDRGLDI